MKLREALVICPPSITIQRAAADEIALMTSMLLDLAPQIQLIYKENPESELVKCYDRWKRTLES